MVNPDPGFQLLACRYLRKQLNRLFGQVAGIRRNDDVECVHQARVASRRLRAALGVFQSCFPARKVRKWRQEIRRVTQELGEARDKDVQIAFAAAVAAKMRGTDAKNRPGVERWLLRLRQEREAVQPAVRAEVDRLEASPALAKLRARVEQTRALLRQQGACVRSEYAFRQSGRQIRKRLRELRKLESCLDDPQAQEEHHQMRIVAKRLRYTLEICNPACGNRLGDVIQAAKMVQTLLGEIHDCDVWAETIESFIADERQRMVGYFGHARNFYRLRPGLEFLRDERIAHRQELFRELGTVWRGHQDRGLWRNLTAVIEGPTTPSGLAETRSECIIGVPKRGPARKQVGRKHMTEESLETTLPGTFYQRGSRWWWRVQLPGEDKPKSRPLRRAGSRETATEKQEAAEIAAEMWQATAPAPSVEVPVEAAPQEDAPVMEAVEEGPAEMPVEPDYDEATAAPAPNAVCECCSRNHLLASEVARIDSGQLLCRDCLAELRRKVRDA
ncbi:MAG: CHAD domain-containing protein [Sedimentisphaerales bacterium]|nr:CHAD domain-containing protein [Sedimentisphaerales bacterium]